MLRCKPIKSTKCTIIFGRWLSDFSKYTSYQSELAETELIKQIEKINKDLKATSYLPFKIHPGAIYTSRLLGFTNLPEPKNSDDYYEYHDNISSMKYSGI
jgi:hypothetical protein